ncbi:SAM-dependent methyltransferase [Spongiactinospora gelatinilytica]|uniref:SAM-dependent methyltransferase n=2 Tax=Spongiactinospora gelatinilytica TaxID=2666298 RepID=A0A2W2F6N6_9ACTN|nr:SAM-dependent methyltransferase [Spongiactinospora gelatinilytica]
MPTISSPGSPSPGIEPHKARAMAESFGIDAERYDRTRLRYPGALVERIVATAPGPDVLDLGCGTGIAACQLIEAGCRVLGVEPDARMAGFARRTGIRSEVATFEEWDPAGRDFDAVIAATAWHWIDPIAGAAKAARVLRPGGLLTAFWNVFQMPPDVMDAFAGSYRQAVPDSPIDLQAMAGPAAGTYDSMIGKATGGIGRTGAFGEVEQWRFEWEWHYTKETWLDQMPTSGVLTRLSPDQLAPILDSVGSAIDRLGGGFTMPYVTMAFACRRNDAAPTG